MRATLQCVGFGPAIVTLAMVALTATARGQIRVHPTGVNVNTQGATTAFLTFGGLGDYEPIEAAWCGALVPAAPARGLRCDPARLFGVLPLRYDRSQLLSGAFTDIMSIPPSVSRRAYQAAAAGEQSDFFYVRRFRSQRPGLPDQYVAVTCRLAGGGARTPFALVDVTLSFSGDGVVPFVRQGSAPPEALAAIVYTGTGRLVGRWEVVRPGEDLPSEVDLLTEGTLPLEARVAQRRYMTVGRFNLFLPPNGRVAIPGPAADRLPTAVEGQYYLLLRIEAVTDKEGDSDRAAAGAGTGLVPSGAVAGFPMPVLRYLVGSGGMDELVPHREVVPLLSPAPNAHLEVRMTFSWGDVSGADTYRWELADERGVLVLGALTPGPVASYRPPPWLVDRPGAGLRWRVLALDARARVVARSGWRRIAR